MTDTPSQTFIDAADALERQQAVVKAARLVLPYWSGEPTPRYPAEEKVLRKALAALDAPPEGEG